MDGKKKVNFYPDQYMVGTYGFKPFALYVTGAEEIPYHRIAVACILANGEELS